MHKKDPKDYLWSVWAFYQSFGVQGLSAVVLAWEVKAQGENCRPGLAQGVACRSSFRV